MPSPRETFIAHQTDLLDGYFSWASGEDEVRRLFERLALDTYDCIAGKVRTTGPFFPWPGAFNFADYDRGAAEAAPADLRERWRDWKREYALLLKRRPVLELRDALHTIGESHNSSSWPYGLEWDILDWIDGADRYALPFDDRHQVATIGFYERLRELRQCVDGWLYHDAVAKRFVLAPASDCPGIRAGLAAVHKQNMTRIYGTGWPTMCRIFKRKNAEDMATRRKILIAYEASGNACQGSKRDSDGP